MAVGITYRAVLFKRLSISGTCTFLVQKENAQSIKRNHHVDEAIVELMIIFVRVVDATVVSYRTCGGMNHSPFDSINRFYGGSGTALKQVCETNDGPSGRARCAQRPGFKIRSDLPMGD